jgi:predicted DCC family thiol-disulfide oxidoreductase YuxK
MRLSAHESESALPREGWILYDGECGFCFRWVHLWNKVIGRRGFALKDLQSASADGSLQIPQENLLDDIRVLTRSGELESGANAYLYSGATSLVGMAFLCNLPLARFQFGALVGLSLVQ